MDAITDDSIETVVLMMPSQSGKTEIELNAIGYYIDQEPSPILAVFPKEDMGKAFSEERLSPMLRDTLVLRGKVKDPRSRDSKNTKLSKHFPGGHISIVGANSPGNLAMRPIRILLFDEIDRYPDSSGNEGDVVDLAKKRTTTFFNRKSIIVSSPTLKGESRIESAYEQSDQRKFYVPCKHCGHHQILLFKNISWEKKETIGQTVATAFYHCEKCGVSWTEKDRMWSVKNGEWRSHSEFIDTAGFWINGLYSPWLSIQDIVKEFLTVRKDPERLKVLVNTIFTETWEDDGQDAADEDSLMNRAEEHNGKIPFGFGVQVCTVDIQDNRFEILVKSFGRNEESWVLERTAIFGDPSKLEIWKKLDLYIQRTWMHENGKSYGLDITLIDTGGHFTDEAYRFIKPREVRRVYGIKGGSHNHKSAAIISRPSKRNKGKINLFVLGVFTAKELIASRLRNDEPGTTGFIHFPKSLKAEYFKELASERKKKKFNRSGYAYYEWVKIKDRNETWDLFVYALAGIRILFSKMDMLNKAVDEINSEVLETEEHIPRRRVLSKIEI